MLTKQLKFKMLIMVIEESFFWLSWIQLLQQISWCLLCCSWTVKVRSECKNYDWFRLWWWEIRSYCFFIIELDLKFSLSEIISFFNESFNFKYVLKVTVSDELVTIVEKKNFLSSVIKMNHKKPKFKTYATRTTRTDWLPTSDLFAVL